MYRFTLTGEQTELPSSGPRIALRTAVVHCCATPAEPNLKLQQSESCVLSDGMVTVTGEGAVFVPTAG